MVIVSTILISTFALHLYSFCTHTTHHKRYLYLCLLGFGSYLNQYFHFLSLCLHWIFLSYCTNILPTYLTHPVLSCLFIANIKSLIINLSVVTVGTRRKKNLHHSHSPAKYNPDNMNSIEIDQRNKYISIKQFF